MDLDVGPEPEDYRQDSVDRFGPPAIVALIVAYLVVGIALVGFYTVKAAVAVIAAPMVACP